MKKLIPLNVNLIPPEADHVFRGKLFDVYQWQQEMFDGNYTTFEGLRRPDIVTTIGLVEGRIVTVTDVQ